MQGSDSSAIPAVILSTLVAICGSVAYGCSVGYSSPVEAGITADLGLSLIEDAWSLYLGRCSLGIGLALMTYVIPIYIAEITPKNVRGAFTAANQLLVASGLSVIYLVGSVVSWRALALIAAVPCLLQVVGLFFIPESPRWLVGVGLMVMQPLVGSAAIAYYASYIFAAADLLTAIIQLPAIVASVLLTDKSGRRPLLLASAIGTCLSLSIIALAFCLQDTNHWNEVTPVLVYIGIMESINKPLNFQFSDISYKHQRFSRKPGDSTPQLQQLDSYIHFPFHDGMEHNSCPIRCISGAGDQGTNT
ncbi:Sugar transporter ERD6-like 11 [Citrus sinensis]|uniref:Sugar transporter ERD6-like 11 n=1 Tax=Citrus sinensis TaxID=2711 RepID=A0ACB8KK74_CITSI|nr:Sugar transporter ERD6-like 11 [Citrus sinensis]